MEEPARQRQSIAEVQTKKDIIKGLPAELRENTFAFLSNDQLLKMRVDTTLKASADIELEERRGFTAKKYVEAIETFNEAMSERLTFKAFPGDQSAYVIAEQEVNARKFDALCTKIETTANIRGVDASTISYPDGQQIQDIVESTVRIHLSHVGRDDREWHAAVYRLLKALVSNSQTHYNNDGTKTWSCWTEASSIEHNLADMTFVLADAGPLMVDFPKQNEVFWFGPLEAIGGPFVQKNTMREMIQHADQKGLTINRHPGKLQFADCLAVVTKEFFYSRDFARENDPHVGFKALMEQAKREPDKEWIAWPGDHSCVWETANESLSTMLPRNAFEVIIDLFKTTGHWSKKKYENTWQCSPIDPTLFQGSTSRSGLLCTLLGAHITFDFFNGTDRTNILTYDNGQDAPVDYDEAIDCVLAADWEAADGPIVHSDVLALAFEAWYFARRSCVPRTVRIRSTFADLS